MEDTFGAFLKRKRIERRLTLRAFCEANGFDPANYSKMERGRLAAPKEEKLEVYMRALGIMPNSPEAREMVRLAAIDRGLLPPRILEDKELTAKLPALFRTIEGDRVDNSVLEELIAAIRRE